MARDTANLELGKAGELRVASELLIRGQRVSLSLVGSGIDLILDDGTKIQVKSSRITVWRHKPAHKYCARYAFSFRHWKQQVGKKRKQELSNVSSDIDFIILWCVNDDIFYVIPASVFCKKKTVSIYCNREPKKQWYEMYRNKWDLIIREE